MIGGIIGSRDRAVAVNNSQYVAVGIVSIAYSAFWGSEARNSAHRVIEDLADLTACVGDLLADVQLVVFAKNSALVFESGEKSLSNYCFYENYT